MKVSGGVTLRAPVARVWAAFRDPALLARAIPGCERLEASGPHAYRITVTTGIASTRGTYAGEVSLLGRQEPTSFAMQAAGAGSPGTVSTTVQIRLADAGDGSTRLTYGADAEVGGMIANVGQQMLSAIAARLAGEFFACLDSLLTEQAVGHTAHTAAGEEVGAVADGRHGGQASAERDVRAAPPRLSAPLERQGFLRGVVAGAAAALAGVIVARLVSRRNSRRDR